MSMLVNSFSVAPIVAVKTYAEFQAHIATLATSGAKTWASASTTQEGAWRTTCATPGGAMNGSPWTQPFRRTSWTSRVVQHCFPSEAVFNAQWGAGMEVFLNVVDVVNQACVAVNRNGYTSGASSGTADICDLFLYYDGEPLQINPFAGTGPTPYTW